MNILVTGGTGYIGSHTCVELLKNNHKIIIADNIAENYAYVSKAQRELDWKTKLGIEEMCLDAWNFERKNVSE